MSKYYKIFSIGYDTEFTSLVELLKQIPNSTILLESERSYKTVHRVYVGYKTKAAFTKDAKNMVDNKFKLLPRFLISRDKKVIGRAKLELFKTLEEAQKDDKRL